MSAEIKDGGPAFPRQHAVADANDSAFKRGSEGMTLRDYFAAKAMQAWFTAWERNNDFDLPTRAYHLADAMLAARERKS